MRSIDATSDLVSELFQDARVINNLRAPSLVPQQFIPTRSRTALTTRRFPLFNYKTRFRVRSVMINSRDEAYRKNVKTETEERNYRTASITR